MRWRLLTSRGEPPHFVKSINLTSCSTRTSATETGIAGAGQHRICGPKPATNRQVGFSFSSL